MSTISYDGQSLMIDGRRVWLVSGAIHYPRMPHQLWPDRIRAAKQAGLNCVETCVFWNIHEPEPGLFNFDGDADLRRFVTLVGEAGMYCILRPGPYVGAEWDFGGLPPWLHRTEGVKLRQANGPFQEACARYLGAVMDQVKDLQITSPTRGVAEVAGDRGGPIILVQAENQWCCHNPEQEEAYHNELARYLRENGCSVPIIDCNMLWARADTAIACWTGTRLATDLRQLRAVQPNAPPIACEYWSGGFDHWGRAHHRDDAAVHLYHMAAILAVGAQLNLYMFHGGTNFGFYGGRTAQLNSSHAAGSRFGFVTTSHDYDAPLSEAGGRGPKFLATKRIMTFANQFGWLLAHLEPGSQPAAVAPDDVNHPPSVLHQHGSQGDVVFLLKTAKDKTRVANLMLPNGQTLPVTFGRDPVAWCVFDANLGGVAELSYTNLRPWAFVDKRMLVLFGPAGSEAVVCIDDAPLQLKVPTGQAPLVEQHEGLTVVVLNSTQVDAAYLCGDGLVVGAAGLDADDEPLPLPGWPRITTIRPDGTTTRQPTTIIRTSPAPRLGSWQRADLGDFVEGASPRFKPIDGPMSLEALGCNYGYGWYRLSIKGKRRGAGKLLAPQMGDRLHVYADGRLTQILGDGPNAANGPTPLRLSGDIVILADNLGRCSDGWRLGEPKGLFGHIYAVRQARLGKPKVVAGHAPDLFELGGFFQFARRGDQPPADALVWRVKPDGRKPLIFDIDRLPGRAMLLVNNRPVGAYDADQTAGKGRFLLEVGRHITGGRNELKLALFAKHNARTNLNKHIHLYQTTANLTAKASWAFARWLLPSDDDFAPLAKTRPAQPCWYRSTFSAAHTDAPLWLEPRGMSKGQVFINGHNAGRYFVATRTGKAMPPQKRYYLPEPWLRTDGPNELLLFDEHGRSPTQCKLVYDPMGPYGK